MCLSWGIHMWVQGSSEARSQFPWSWSYRWVWGSIEVLGTKPGFLQEQQVLWTMDQFLQPPFTSEFYLCCVCVFAWMCMFSICRQKSKYRSVELRSKDNWWEPDLSFHQVGSGDQLRLSILIVRGFTHLSHLADLLAKLWWLYWYCVLVLCLGFLSCCWDKIYWRRTLKLKGLPDSQLQVTVRQRGRKLYQLVIP